MTPIPQSRPPSQAQAQGSMSIPPSTAGSSRPSISPDVPFAYPHADSQYEIEYFPRSSSQLPYLPTQVPRQGQGQGEAPSQPYLLPQTMEGEYEQDSYVSDEVDLEGEPDERNRFTEGESVDQSATGGTQALHSTSSESLDLGEGNSELSGIKEAGGRKKPRITLPRGRACVACRNRKLKCTGEFPCQTCQKAGLECRYQELPRRRSRAVILEERVAELESALNLRPGEPLSRRRPPHPPSHSHQRPSHSPIRADFAFQPPRSHDSGPPYESRSHSSSSGSATSLAQPMIGNQVPSVSLHSHADLPPYHATINSSKTEIVPNSPLELALIQVVLPHTPHLGLPLHPQRFLALLALPQTSPERPHPALLYILFAQAVRVLEVDVPVPRLPTPPPSVFPPSFTPPLPAPHLDRSYILSQVGGTSLNLLERARGYLDAGIRNVERPFDLVRAAVGIACYLYSIGRFIEGWNIPVSRLLISCGLHRITGNYIPPDGSSGVNPDLLPPPYAPAHQYAHSHSLSSSTGTMYPTNPSLPVLRMRPIIIPPARDEIELAERVMTFWAAKMQDWEAAVGWGWSVSLADGLCTTEWGWGWGTVEAKPPSMVGQRFAIRDLYDPSSMLHSSPAVDSTYVLAVKSLGLLHRSNALFDLAGSSYPVQLPDGRIGPTHIPSLAAVQSVETALRLFRQRIPACFADTSRDPPSAGGEPAYDGPSDPWWILFHANLYTAEMLMWKEMAHHRPQAYQTAVSCARALVGLATGIQGEQWAHVDMIVVINISLSSRFLFKEADRLRLSGQNQAAALASEEAEMLRSCLSGSFAKYTPMSSLHALIVQRVREGWPEKEGEYERV